MGFMSPWHWAIVVVVLVLLFGAKKLPDMARGLGQSLRIFKSEVKEMQKDDQPSASAAPAEPPRELPSADGEQPGTSSNADAKKSA
ncbi:Sec-independent protein translocase subunit TatA [Gordonia paraffinivorans]|uniref:Sec-independent protein translocase subunit TatA n=1 Tax=Gordonia paraffinivorans TaxID=175628 RepID=UPI00242E6B1C|nr:Sec-independent protein translocase subunit TatA [Gordonia paraffinivorans]